MRRRTPRTLVEKVQARLEKELAPRLRRALERINVALAEATADPAVLNLLVAGRTTEAIDLVIGAVETGAAREAVRAELADALAIAGKRWSAVVVSPMLGVKMSYNALNAASIRALSRLELQFFPPIFAETRKAFTVAIRTGLDAGVNPRDVARSLRDYVGLTEYDARIISTFELQVRGDPAAALGRTLRDRRFDETLLRATQGGAVPEATIVKMREAYVQRLHNWRAETWSRTAALNSTREANLASWSGAADALGIERGGIEKGWSTTLDGRQRDEHDELNDTWVPMDSTFPNGAMTPGDGEWNCRCVMLFRLAVPDPK